MIQNTNLTLDGPDILLQHGHVTYCNGYNNYKTLSSRRHRDFKQGTENPRQATNPHP